MIDPEGAVFLFRYDNPGAGVHWAMPGGGLDAGETPREGALRELREETGWTDLKPGELLCTWEHDFTRAGIQVHQHEHIYLSSGPRREPLDGLAAARRRRDPGLALVDAGGTRRVTGRVVAARPRGTAGRSTHGPLKPAEPLLPGVDSKQLAWDT